MTITAVTGPGRVVQFLWGPNQQNTLTFAYPQSIDEPRFWRQQRKGSEQQVPGPVVESWTTARDYMASLKARWLQLPFWAGPGGFQAFLDWGINGQPFTLVPDAANSPLYGLTGCLLVDPFDKYVPSPEIDGSQVMLLVIRNPTFDMGLAWR